MSLFILICTCWKLPSSYFPAPIWPPAPAVRCDNFSKTTWTGMSVTVQTVSEQSNYHGKLSWPGWQDSSWILKTETSLTLIYHRFFSWYFNCSFVSHWVWQKGQLYQDQWSVVDHDLFWSSAWRRRNGISSPLYKPRSWIYWDLPSKAERQKSACMDTLWKTAKGFRNKNINWRWTKPWLKLSPASIIKKTT